MWGDPDPDPGGQQKTPSTQELTDLRDQNEQQLVLIAQLKGMLRKESSNVSHEKVEEYVNTLTKVKAKRSKQKKDDPGSSSKAGTSSLSIDANKKERINLLRQQLEENKARLAERGKSQKGIEEMVTQLQAQFKDTHTFASSTPLNVSLQEIKTFDYSENTPQKDLYNILLTKEKKITELLNKSQKLEGSVLDLQENLKEKDSVIDARTKAITLMTDSLSKKGKNTLDALEETKEQMRKMQENFVSLENDMKSRQLALLNDLKMKNFEINDLKEIIGHLEHDKVELEERISKRSTALQDSELTLNISLEKVGEENKQLLEKINQIESENKEADLVSSELILVKTTLEKVENENKQLLEKIKELESSIAHNEHDIQHQNKDSDHLLSQVTEVERKLEQTKESKRELKHRLNTKLNEMMEENNNVLSENKRLAKENTKYITEIGELQKRFDEAMADLTLLKSTGMGASGSSTDNDELIKLKKQAEESNKSMIKMRAMQKGKIKELNKKLDQFRKMNDSNILIGQLQNEITKLNEKIAELEDEKGNMQLKMVESTGSSKGDSNDLEDQVQELNNKLKEATEELEIKTKIIETLQSDVSLLKADLKQTNEEQVKVTAQVSTEMSLIQYEEQIEKIGLENEQLRIQLEAFTKEKDELLETIENLKKEKQEVSSKLDSYIQENMELIDKLEKLSAEKVSSVESIEIVEGLTQQEKLELAAYQKHINPEETEKTADDETLEPPAELNESVLQLSEDTAELLQKIEMFTQERKEVMQKMDSLKTENDHLEFKIKEIENNRDILEETYEQIQNEKETLILEKEKLLQQLEEHSATVDKQNHEKKQSANLLDTKLKELQDQCNNLTAENNELKHNITIIQAKMEEKETLEKKLYELTEQNYNLTIKIKNSSEEINDLKTILEENKNELMSSATKISQLNNTIDDKERDIEEFNKNIQYLNEVINDLHLKNDNYEHMESELQNLSTALTEQMAHAVEYEKNIYANGNIIGALNQELQELKSKLAEHESLLEVKETDINQLKKEVANKEETIKHLQTALSEKDDKFKVLNEEMREKYVVLQQQLESNGSSLQTQLNEVSGKNKDQLEKMKKLAANLKKKTQAYHVLEEQYNKEKNEWEIRLQDSIKSSEEKILSLTKELKEIQNHLKVKIEENISIQKEIAMLKKDINVLEQTNADQQNYIQDLKQKQDKLTEVSLQQELSESLHEDIDNSFPKNIPEEKIRELELLLETKDSEIYHYIERIDKFEKNARLIQEEKFALELKNNELLEKLDLATKSYTERDLFQNQISQQLSHTVAENEQLSRTLEEANRKLEVNVNKIQENDELIKKLKIKLKKAHDKVTELKSQQANSQELETLNEKLKSQISNLETNQKLIQSENESLQKRNMSDYEKIEADYQSQLDELLKIKTELSIENEKLQELVKEMESKEQDLNMELDDYKSKLIQDERNHNDMVNKFQNDIKYLKEELELSQTEVQKLLDRLKNVSESLDRAMIEVETLNNALTDANMQINDLSKCKSELELMSSERDEVNKLLAEINEKLATAVSDKELLQQELNISNNDKLNLGRDVDQLKENIRALEFAKFSLEASYESARKEEVVETVEPDATVVLEVVAAKKCKPQSAQPNIQWPEQEAQQPLASQFFDQISQSGSSFDNLTFSAANVNMANPFAQQIEQQIQFDQIQQPTQQEQLEASVSKPDIETDREHQYSSKVENSPEALLKKIKTLEFLLYNVDKEKDIALEQCSNMVNELAQLLSQNSNSPENKTSIIDESQIMSQDEIDNLNIDRQALTAMEYTPTTIGQDTSSLPVQEDIIQPKKAYLCFDDDDPPATKKDEGAMSLEAQIMSDGDIKELSNAKKLQELEYEKVDVSQGQQKQPVIESMAQPKHAYLCFSKEDKPQSLEAFEENDDGWGWGPDEVKLDEEYLHKIENTPQIKNLLVEIQQLKEHIKVLQLERENHLEEINQLQIKSGKLIRKCKHLKQLIDQGGASKKQEDGGFFDLNETIQEEFKSQIQQLEKRIKDISSELEKEKIEKNSLTKKVDVLTSANDRMVEMKEIQDAEVLRWQRKHKETVEKLQELQWNNDEFEKPQNISAEIKSSATQDPEQSGRIAELEKTLQDLALDNEELQALLEEQTKLRAEAEKLKTGANETDELRQIIDHLNKEIETYKLQNSEMQKELFSLKEDKEIMNSEINELIKSVHSKEEEMNKLHVKASETEKKVKELINIQNDLIVLQNQIQNQNFVLEEKNQLVVHLESSLEQNKSTIEKLEQQITLLNNDLLLKSQNIEQLQNSVNPTIISGLESEIDTLNRSLKEKEIELENTQKFIMELQQQLKEMSLLQSGGTENLQEKYYELQQHYEELQERSTENITAKNKFVEDLDVKMKLIDELNTKYKLKDEAIDKLQKELQNKEKEHEEKINILMNELNANWQIQVDQRGADVAESWKMHLEMIDKDYTSIQDSLKSTIDELEQKCNNLITKNSELTSTLENYVKSGSEGASTLSVENQIHQQTINALNLTIKQKEQEIEELQNQLAQCELIRPQLELLEKENLEKESKIHGMSIIIETTQKQFDEKREVIEEIVSLLEKHAPSPISYEKQDILAEFNRQTQVNSEKDNEIQVLNQRINALEKTTEEKVREITGLSQVIDDLEKELSVIHQKDAEIVTLSTQIKVLQHEKEALEEQLKVIENERDNMVQENSKLVSEHCDVENIRLELSKSADERSLLQGALNEYQTKLQDATYKLTQQAVELEKAQQTVHYYQDNNNASMDEINRLKQLLEKHIDLETTLSQYRSQINELMQKLNETTQELELARQNIRHYEDMLKAYNLREEQHQKSLEAFKSNQFADMERHYEELVSNKDLDNQMLKAQVQELLNANKEYNVRLSQEFSLKQETEQKLQEQTQIVDDDTKQLEELKLIIEDQETRIEQLKKELFDKSNQYDSLIAEMDLGGHPVTHQPSSSMDTLKASVRAHQGDDLTDPVSRAELDLALYMLHQRDVRCEELTVELTHLLEERDTLQLKLSNAIREKEELRKVITENTVSNVGDQGNLASTSNTSNVYLTTSGTELAKDPLKSEEHLASKLSQLKNISYKRDKTFVDDQTARNFQQLAIMEQHMNDTSKLPPEAAAKLVDACYTLSRDVQSPSKVILNWLWGKSPPKANDS